MIYTVNLLLTELGNALPLGDGERYRRTAVRGIREVLVRIGLEKTCFIEPQVFALQAGRIEPLPDEVLDVLDAGFSPDTMQGERYEHSGYSSGNPLAFIPTPFGVEFPNLEAGTIWLLVARLPVDAQGDALIPDMAYEACYDYALAKILPQFPQHPRFSERRALMADAETAIDRARAQFNKRNRPAHNRAIRRNSRYGA